MAAGDDASLQLLLETTPLSTLVKPGQKISKKRPAAPLQAMGFALDELKEARLAPIVSFKGRGKGQGEALPEPGADGAGEAS